MALTIDQYLQILPDYTFSDAMIQRVLMIEDISTGVLASSVTEESRDMAEARMWFSASIMAGGGGYSKRINNRQISETRPEVSPAVRKSWLERANELRKKWGAAAFQEKYEISDATFLW